MKSLCPLCLSLVALCCLGSCTQTIPLTPPATITDAKHLDTYQRALAGDADALYFVGLCYLTGKYGYPQDLRLGSNAFEMAAIAGHTDAQVFIGMSYESGTGRIQNFSKALSYYSMAAQNGSANGRKHYDHLLEVMNQNSARMQENMDWINAMPFNEVIGR